MLASSSIETVSGDSPNSTAQAAQASPALRVPPAIDYDSPQAISALLEAEGLAMRKRYGQNFLVARHARARVMAEIGLEPGASAWEIGPGIGAMTHPALETGARLSAFEIDKGFAALLREAYGTVPGFALVEGDFLKTWRGELAARGRPDRVFGNLPYNAAAAMVAALVEGLGVPERMVFMVQKEAARRMAAGPGTKDYASFSVLCSSSCRVRVAFDLGAGAFWPQPRVASSLVVMEARADRAAEAGTREFGSFVRALFSSRRKTARNNLKPLGHSDEVITAALASCGFRQDVRGEALDPAELLALYRAIGKP